MKRSPEKVSRRCARISSALSFFLFLSSFGRVARPYTRRIKSVESRDVAQIMRTVPVAVRHSAFSTLPVLSLFDFQGSRRNQTGNRDICSQEIVLSPRLPVADRWTGHKFKLQLLWFFKYCSVHSPLVFDAFAMLPFLTTRKETYVYMDN